MIVESCGKVCYKNKLWDGIYS